MDYTELAHAVRVRAEKARDCDEDLPEYHDRQTDAELLLCLARLLEGNEPHRAFGAPGHWGYSSDIGKALQRAYAGAAGENSTH